MHRLQENHGVALIISLSEVPHHDNTFAWDDDYAKSEKLQEKIDSLNEERARIESLPISNNEKLIRVKAGYDDFQKKVAAHVQRYLSDPTLWQNGVQNPLTRFEIRFCQPRENFYIPPLSMFEDAIKHQPDDGVSDKDRAKQLGDISSKIVKLQAEMPTTITKEHHIFVKFWRELQGQLSEPTGPHALSLDASSDIEKRAWKTLGLAEYVNERGILPNPAD